MFSALFHHIPRCLFEPFAILSLIGLVLFFREHWKKDRGGSILILSIIGFMILWRLAMPINADRYALLLLPPALFFSIEAVYRLIDLLPFRRKEYAVICTICGIAVLFTASAVKAFHVSLHDNELFEIVRLLRTDAAEKKGPLSVCCRHDLTCFLDKRFHVRKKPLPGESADYLVIRKKIRKKERDSMKPASGMKKLYPPPSSGEKSFYELWKKTECIQNNQGGKT